MRCHQCQQKQATIHLRMRVNHAIHQLALCDTCYHDIQQELQSPSGMNPQGNNPGGASFPNFFEGFMSGGPGSNGGAGGHQHPQAKSNIQTTQGQGGGGLLDQLGRNLTNAARNGMIDPVIGRAKELKQVIETLNRRTKNNPVLIGEPGVGKTAIAEGLALQIVQGEVPRKLKEKQIYLLDVASLVANTGIRGQFEERMKQLIEELQQRQEVILFIDEIHLIVGAGSAEGSMDAGNILKPALARGDLQIIGATTLKEYRRIEKDAALERRLQPVMVKEPTTEETLLILQGLMSRYEDYHQVSYSEEAIKACVTLSHRYIQDRHLPDKAIDLIDQAGSRLNLVGSEKRSGNAEEQLEQVRAEKEKATQQEQYERAAQLRDEEQQLLSHLEKSKAEQKQDREKVTVEHIQQLIEEKTGIPVGKLEADEQAKLKDLDLRLSAQVIGQEEAVNKVTKAIRRGRAGLKAKNRPVGSFLFVGPTGVGKTELSKSLAQELFGNREAMIRLDMSEYMEKHSVSKLIGSPPGYVGHEEAGQLTEKVRRNPYCILLLDEIEKAHPDVQHMFLQIMEDGRLTDSQGRTVSFKDVVIIMTSNAGTTEHRTNAIGFGQEEQLVQTEKLLAKLGQYFKPEFLNRFDSIVDFMHLTEANMLHIVDLMLKDLQNNLDELEIVLSVSDEVKQELAKKGYHPAFGARPLRRTIQEQIEDGIADLLLEHELVNNVQVELENGVIVAKQTS